MDLKPAVAVALRAMREERGLSQAAVAKELNKTSGTISHWETGRATPSVNDIAAYATACGTSEEVVSEAIETALRVMRG